MSGRADTLFFASCIKFSTFFKRSSTMPCKTFKYYYVRYLYFDIIFFSFPGWQRFGITDLPKEGGGGGWILQLLNSCNQEKEKGFPCEGRGGTDIFFLFPSRGERNGGKEPLFKMVVYGTVQPL